MADAPKSPFDLTKQVTSDRYNTTEEALAAAQGVAVMWPDPADASLFPTAELPAQQQPSPFKLSK